MSFGEGLRVLVVDDEPSNQLLLEKLLCEHGFVVTSVDTLAQAKAAWCEAPSDLVILDKNLPDGSGLELAQQLVADAAECEIIIISAYANVDSALEAVRLKVADYILKPFSGIDEVVDRVRRVVEYQGMKRQNAELITELQAKNAELAALAVRDSLTGLFNHAFFQDRMAREVSRSKRHEHEFGLVFVDIDNFKEVNDNMGHQVGDLVLQGLAEILLGEGRASDESIRLREHDIAARYGGDEFVLVLPETPKAGAVIKAERLRAFVEKHDFGSQIPGITLSMGVAAYPGDANDRAGLIAVADRALYAAKAGGRNRVVAYDSDTMSGSLPAVTRP